MMNVSQLLRDHVERAPEEQLPEVPWPPTPQEERTVAALERKCAALEQRLADEKAKHSALRQQVANDDKGFAARRAELAAVLQTVRTEIADRIAATATKHANDQAAQILESLRTLVSTLR